VSTSEGTTTFSIRKTSLLMTFKEKMALYCVNHTWNRKIRCVDKIHSFIFNVNVACSVTPVI